MLLVALSDLHGDMPDVAALPEGDLLLIAGDLTNLGTHYPSEVRAVEQFFADATDKYPFVGYIFGNHDIALTGLHFTGIPVDFLEGRVATVAERTITGINLSMCFDKPHLARQWRDTTADRERDAVAFAALPPVDIVVSHCPPLGYCDLANNGVNIGSPGLTDYIQSHRPRLVLCGHVHEATGITTLGETCIVNTARQVTAIAFDGNAPTVIEMRPLYRP